MGNAFSSAAIFPQDSGTKGRNIYHSYSWRSEKKKTHKSVIHQCHPFFGRVIFSTIFLRNVFSFLVETEREREREGYFSSEYSSSLTLAFHFIEYFIQQQWMLQMRKCTASIINQRLQDGPQAEIAGMNHSRNFRLTQCLSPSAIFRRKQNLIFNIIKQSVKRQITL